MTNKHTCLTALTACAVALGCLCSEAKTIGLYRGDKRLGDLSGTLDTMTNAGWKVEKIDRKTIADEKAIEKYDVLYFPGGFNMYFWTGHARSSVSRRALARYVAKGGGVILTANRSGFVRSATRPAFPQVGAASCRLSSGWIGPVGDSVLAKAFDGRMQAFSSGDHLKIDVGPAGTSFCGVDGMSCGAYGEVGAGRVIVLGAHFSYRIDEESAKPLSKILRACLDWAAGGRRPDVGEAARLADRAEVEVLRRERLFDVALDERGPDSVAGTIPRARDFATAEPEALAYKLDYQSSFLKSEDAARANKTSAALKASAAKVNAQAMKLVVEAKARLDKMNLAELDALKQDEYTFGPLVTNLTKLVDARIVATAKRQIAQNAPVVEAVKLERVKKELAEDTKLVPGLIAELASATDPKRRYKAAVELGRIVIKQDAKVVAALVKALDDADADVRSQAAASLGWMQTKDAVPALMKKLDGPDRRLANRAAQVLGQIGDDRAVPALLNLVEKNQAADLPLVLVALGQLKAKGAVSALRKIALAGLEPDALKRAHTLAEIESAILALGYIGEKSVAKDLEALAAANKGDGPRDHRSRKKEGHFRNPYSIGDHSTTSSSFGIEWTAQMALERIAAGGRAEKGVSQDVRLRAKDTFYRITGNCNALAGRVRNGMFAFRDRDEKMLVAHLWEAGATGIHNAWGTPGADPEKYKNVVRELGEFDMTFIDVFSGYGGWLSKPETEFRLEGMKDFPAFGGFWAEETWPEFGMRHATFLSLAEKRYGKDWRKRFPLTKDEIAKLDDLIAANAYFDVANLCHDDGKEDERKAEDSFHAPWDAGLRTLLIELQGDFLVEIWTESQDYLKTRRMGCAHAYVVSTAEQGRYFGDNRAFNAIDSMGLESYQSFGRSTSYWMQRYRDGNARSSMSELYNWYCPSVEHARRGFWQNAVHGKCFYNFGLMEIFKHPSGEYLWRWDAGRWDAFREVFRRVRDNRAYYRIRPSAAKVAVLYSERASSITRNNAYQPCAVPQRADQNAMALWVSLGQSHVQADVVYVDEVKIEKLRKYAVLVLSDAKYLTDGEVATLRAWVREGGVLIAEGDASLFDAQTARRRDNYALADVFGADFVRADYLADGESDTFCRRRGDARAQFKFVPGLDGSACRFHFEDSIHRDMKPTKSVRKLTFEDGLAAEIDAAIGIDRVKPTTAKAIAKFEDGAPAILANGFGKGRCYFQCSAYPAMGHVTSEWEMMPNRWDFWPGNREMLEKLVREGLAFAQAEQPVEARGLSGDVEVTVDDGGDQLVVHLLDYNCRNASVKGGGLVVGGKRPIKRVFYPDTNTEVDCAGREIRLRTFSGYDMVVIQFGE